MNELVNKLLLAGDKLTPEMHLKQHFKQIYLSCLWMERIQKFKGAGHSRYIYRNELDKAYFQHDMAYGDFKVLAKRTASDKVLRDKAFNIAKNPKYDRYQRDLTSLLYTFFDKKSKGSGFKDMLHEQLAEALHKPIIRKSKIRRVYQSFKDNIWGANLADMQLISKVKKGICFLLCVIDIFSKYASVVVVKDKQETTITSAFQKILDESKHKTNKIWVDKGSEFYNRSMKSW